MQFDPRDIRVSMDVYAADQVYLGSVLRVPDSRPRTHESGDSVIGDRSPGSDVSGEALGPAPTQVFGNTGPVVQSAQSTYATRPDEHRILTEGFIEVGKWWGLVGRKRIDLDLVQSVSMDNVILHFNSDELG